MKNIYLLVRSNYDILNSIDNEEVIYASENQDSINKLKDNCVAEEKRIRDTH